MPVRFGSFVLDSATASLTRDTVTVAVQPKVFQLLELLTAEPDRVHSRDELAQRLWPGVHVGEDALHQLLRRTRRALDDDANEPRWIAAVPRLGWRFIGEVESGPHPASSRGAGADVFGRSTLIAEVRAAVAGGRVVVLHGAAGAGKTRVARELGPACWVDLRNARNAADVCRALAGALGVPLDATPEEHQPARLARALRARRGHVVLDGADGVVDGLAALLPVWEGKAAVVITSRHVVPFAASLVFSVAPLHAADAHALFVARARSARGAELGPEELRRVGEVVGCLDGLPLAIELAASRLRVLSVDALATRVQASFRTGLHSALDLSWELLSERDAHVLAACCVLPVSFQVADADALLDEDTTETFERLVDASLVHGVAPDLCLLDTIRSYAAVQLDRSGMGPDRVARWSAVLLERSNTHRPGFFRWDPVALVALAAQRESLAAQLGRDSLPAATRLALAISLASAVRYTGPWVLALEALERAIGAVAADGAVQAEAWAMLGEYRIRCGAAVLGRAALDIALADPGADDTILAYAHFLRARLLHATGDASASAEASRRAIGLAQRAGNDALFALAHDAAGLAAAATGDEAAMESHYSDAIERTGLPGLGVVRGMVAQNHAACLGRYGRHNEALAQFRLAVEGIGSLPFPHVRATALGNFGAALVKAGRGAEAVAALREALDVAVAIGDHPSERQHAGNLGEVLAEADDPGARVLLDRALALTPLNDLPERALALRRLAMAACGQKDVELAEARIAEALAAARQEGGQVLGETLVWGGIVARARGVDPEPRFAEARGILGTHRLLPDH